jgi:hypothetical protein
MSYFRFLNVVLIYAEGLENYIKIFYMNNFKTLSVCPIVNQSTELDV